MLHCFISLLDCIFTGNSVGVCSIGLGVEKHFTKFQGVPAPKRLRNTDLDSFLNGSSITTPKFCHCYLKYQQQKLKTVYRRVVDFTHKAMYCLYLVLFIMWLDGVARQGSCSVMSSW